MSIDPLAPSFIAEPIHIDSEDQLDWFDTADVVVVGYGGAGVCAALEAKAQGADVLALERFDGGGATAISGGVFYGGGTKYQKEAGYEDDPDNMYRYLKNEVGDVVRDETLRRFCEQSAPNMDWLTEHGVEFGSIMFKPKTGYPPPGYDLYFSGNENSYDNEQIAKPAPRGHKARGEGFTGKDLFGALQQSAEKQGVRVLTQSRVNRLILNKNGEVVGAEISHLRPGSKAYQKHQKIIASMEGPKRFVASLFDKALKDVYEVEQSAAETLYIRANKAVIMCTGSYAQNRPMLEHHAPLFKGYMPLGALGCDGSGIGLGQSVGAATGKMESATAWRTISSPIEFLGGIVVNKNGQRFVNEDAYLGRIGHEIAHQPEGKAWLIIDAKTYWHAYKTTIPKKGDGWMWLGLPLLVNLVLNKTRGKTLSQLAKKCGFDEQEILTTVETYNQDVLKGHDALKKKANLLATLEKGPFYAIDISISNPKLPAQVIPTGGLVVDEDTGQVLDEKKQTIKGLYAAGRGVVGIPSGFYVSGSAIADCVFSGRRAGLHAAKN